ncbi:MAG: Brp/Blh family beta-carotene 15,15'-dioxygenase [Bacteroidota bacterium]
MTKAIFIFIASILLVYPVVSGIGEISLSNQLFICLPFILFLGLPHGAIDNVLFVKDNPINNSEFIALYLVSIVLYIVLWLIFPISAYMLFLILSAYHFGQSQFTHYFDQQRFFQQLLFAAWGISILTGFMYFKAAEIELLMIQSSEFSFFRSVHQEDLMFGLFVGSTIITIMLLLILGLRKKMKWEAFFMEHLVLLLILTCFYLMPLLIGFTLYFVVLHSFKVLREEYDYLHAEMNVNSLSGFVRIVAPFSLFAIFGIILLFALIYFKVLAFSYGYCLLIIISSITLPHVFVMNKFYDLLFTRNFFKTVV